MSIETKPYIDNAFHFNNAERDIQESVMPNVPRKTIDVHTHLGRRKDADGLAVELYTNMISTFTYFSREEHYEARRTLWTDGFDDITQVAFCFPFRGINIKSGNDYVFEVGKIDKNFIPFLTGDPLDIAYTLHELDTREWKGVKIHPEQLEKKVRNITDFFPHPVLSKINEEKLPITLHLPTNLMIDYPELTNLAEIYPHVHFIVAHFGMSRGNIQLVEKALMSIAAYDNIFLDTSWFIDGEVIKRGLKIVGPDKILYASDQPYNLIRARFVTHPRLGERVLTDFPYHWANPEEQRAYQNATGLDPHEFSNFHFEGLRALMEAIDKCSETETEKDTIINKIFITNAQKILGIKS
ncbi:MAG: amidohydrolase family protein [Patescibacteria group bacterium]